MLEVLGVVLFAASQGILVSQLYFPSSAPEADMEGAASAQLHWALIALLQLIGTLLAWRLTRPRAGGRSPARLNLVLVVTVLVSLLCAVSSFWSIDPQVTARRSFALASNLLFAVFVMRAVGIARTEHMMLLATALPVAVSVMGYLLGFDWARMENAYLGAARGMYMQKNVFGMYAWIALLFSCHVRLDRRWVSIAAISSSALAVVISQSATSLIALCFAMGVYIAMCCVPRFSLAGRAMLVSALLISMGAASLLAYGRMESVAAMFGRDLTLTGRTEIWSYVIDAINQRPMLGYGYGYGAFWRTDGFASYFVANRFGFFVSHSHSSMLDAALDLGVPVAVLVSLMLVLGCVSVGRHLLVGRNVRSQALWSALLIGLGITSLSEPVWLVHTALATPLFWIAVVFSRRMPADTGGSLGV